MSIDTLTATHSMTNGSMDVYHCGTVNRGKTTFAVKRLVFRDENGVETGRDTHLIGARGAEYLLRKFLGEDVGARQMISLTSGAEYRSKGNVVKVVEIAGIIEFHS